MSAEWLQARQGALANLRSDYEAQRTLALANPQSGAGWIDPPMSPDTESGSAGFANPGATRVFLSGEVITVQGTHDNGPETIQTGQWREFNEEAFRNQYVERGPTAGNSQALQTLSSLYGSGAEANLSQTWVLDLALRDQPVNAGPAPAGHAMGDAAQLGMLDLYLADPTIQSLLDAYGGPKPAPPAGALAMEQVRLYGGARYEQLTRMGTAMAAVRSHYIQALAQAEQSRDGPGWTQVERISPAVPNEFGTRGADTRVTERVFDVDAFTAWYTQQDGLTNRVFRDSYGQSHTALSSQDAANGESTTATVVTRHITFDNPNWSSVDGGPMTHQGLASLSLNSPPRLHRADAVGFDLEAGWATPQGNIRQGRDWLETLAQVVIIGAVTWVSGGVLGPQVAAAMGVTSALGSAVVVGAVAGAGGAIASGVVNDNLSWRGVLRGALSGGLTAGLMQGIGGLQFVQDAGAIGQVAVRTTVQGGINALLGGSFRDGAIAGLATGLADLTGANLQQGIDDAIQAGSMSAAEAIGARTVARMLTSAIRILGNPGDPRYAFASDFVGSLVNDGLNAARDNHGAVQTPALDDDGNLMPGVVDPNAPLVQQQTQLSQRLQGQGLSADQANLVASQALLGSIPQLLPLLEQAARDPRTSSGRLVVDGEHDQALAEVNAEQHIDPEGNPVILPVGLGDDLGRYLDRVLTRVGGSLRDTLAKVLDAIEVKDLVLAQAGIRDYLNAAGQRGGLSEAEIMGLGVLYAANEALFPTTLLDVIPGGAKALTAVAGVVRAGGNAADLARVTRVESRAMAESERFAQMQAAAAEAQARAAGRNVVRETPGVKGNWNSTLNGPLDPNTTFILSNGHAYTTDSLGRVIRAEGVIDINRMDRNLYQQARTGAVGGEGYEGGHLIGSLFGGAGEAINLIPQLRSVNRVDFRAIERSWASAIRDGKTVHVSVSPFYGNADSVPTRLFVNWTIDGVQDSAVLHKGPGGT